MTTGCHPFTQDTLHLSNEPRAPDLLVTQTQGRRGRGTARGRAHGPRLLGAAPARPSLLAPRDPPLLASEDPPLLAPKDPLPRPPRTHHPIPGGAKAMLVSRSCFTQVSRGHSASSSATGATSTRAQATEILGSLQGAHRWLLPLPGPLHPLLDGPVRPTNRFPLLSRASGAGRPQGGQGALRLLVLCIKCRTGWSQASCATHLLLHPSRAAALSSSAAQTALPPGSPPSASR